MEIEPYTIALHRPAVERLNAKMAAAGSEWRLPAEERPAAADELAVWIESFVARDGDDILGGYLLKHQGFLIHGERLDVGNVQMPLSLGHLDGSHSNVGVALLFDLIRRSPLAYSLGLGSESNDFARLLAAAGWQHTSVPFYFSVKSPGAFAKNIRLPAEHGRTQAMLRALGGVGLASPALRAQQRLRSRGQRAGEAAAAAAAYDRVLEVPSFGGLADDLFAAQGPAYSYVGDRGSAALADLYPADDERYIRLVVEKDGAPVGWCVLIDTRMNDDKYFGDMRVGTLVDCFAAPENAPPVVAAADDHLTQRGVDLVLSNQLHESWCDALLAAGHQEGPTNMFFYYSTDLGRALDAGGTWRQRAHLTRGDGDGPTNL